jgi:outer membrane protein assembly factor BamE (lipoprotein component of BamABCDE complex)
MKITKITLALFSIVLLLAVGCKKDETNISDAASLQSGKSQISCKVSGAATSTFSSNSMVSTVLKSGELMNISGGAVSGMSSELVMLLLPANIKVGTYSSSNWDYRFSLVYSNAGNGWAADQSKEFKVEVTKATSTEIEGTFSGILINETLKNQVAVSAGKFAAKY